MSDLVAARQEQDVVLPALSEGAVCRPNRHHITPADANQVALPGNDYTLLGLTKREWAPGQMFVDAVIER